MNWMSIDQQNIRFRLYIKLDYVGLIWKRGFVHMEKNAISLMEPLIFPTT